MICWWIEGIICEPIDAAFRSVGGGKLLANKADDATADADIEPSLVVVLCKFKHDSLATMVRLVNRGESLFKIRGATFVAGSGP